MILTIFCSKQFPSWDLNFHSINQEENISKIIIIAKVALSDIVFIALQVPTT